MNECICCYNELEFDICLKYENEVYKYCYNCFDYIKVTKFLQTIRDLLKEDCLASLKRMLSKGLPYKVDDELSNTTFYFQNKEITCLLDPIVNKVEQVNEVNIILKELIKDLEVIDLEEFRNKVKDIICKNLDIIV